MNIIQTLKYRGNAGFFIAKMLHKIYWLFKYNRLSDEKYITKKFFSSQGYQLNLKSPKSLNEKLQWLKLNDRKPIYTTLADKLAVRTYINNKLGDGLLIPLLYQTTDTNTIVPNNLPNEPFIIKANHNAGCFVIVRDKKLIDWQKVQTDCKWWLSQNYYYNDREWPYKNIKPSIIVEQLLLNKKGFIPNDYKVNCINGKPEFIYVSVDREGVNKRNIYDANWQPLYFTWANKKKDFSKLRGQEIAAPATLKEMLKIATQIAKDFAYIRVDFYDVDGVLYIGEITQYHGGGFDRMHPIEWDYKYGELLDISNV